MRYVVDSSVWIEALLDQARSAEAKAFLAATPANQLAISDFALHSIGVILTRKGFTEAYAPFLSDVIVAGRVNILTIPTAVLGRVASLCDTLDWISTTLFNMPSPRLRICRSSALMRTLIERRAGG